MLGEVVDESFVYSKEQLERMQGPYYIPQNHLHC